MGEYFTTMGGCIVAEVSIDANAINGSGRAERPALMIMLQMLFRSPKQLNTIFNFRELRCRLSPFDGTYIADSLPTWLDKQLGPDQELPNQSIYLEIPLDQKRIAVINNLRNGGDMKFRLDMDLFADGLIELRGAQNVSLGFGLKGHHHMRAQVQVHIPRSTWAERILPQLEFGKVHLLELPVIPIEQCAEIKAAFHALQHAYKLEAQGFYDDAAAACRKALEPFFERVTKTDEKGERKALILKAAWETRLGKATYDWLNAAFIAVKRGTDEAHHLSSSSFKQSETQMLLAVTTALIAYAIKTRPDELKSPA